MQCTRSYTSWCWSRPDLKGCIQCGSDTSKHHSMGICKKCSWRNKAQRERDRKKVDPEYHAHVKVMAAAASRKRLQSNEEARIKGNLQCKVWYEKNREYRKKYHKEYQAKTATYQKFRKIKYSLGLNKEQVLSLYSLRGHKCWDCGKPHEEVRIDIHHIDGNGKMVAAEDRNNNPENLMLLCVYCHTRLEHMRRLRLNEYNQYIEKII